MDEVIDGIFHWTAEHQPIGARVSSYFIADPAVVIDPKIPEDGWDALPGTPLEVLLSSGHHVRDATAFADRFDIPIRALPAALEYIGHAADMQALAPGEPIEGIVTPLTIGAICQDEGAVHIARGPGAMLFADGVQRTQEQLGFFPDSLLGDDPEQVKRGLRHAYRHVLERYTFDALLFAHGDPIASGGADALGAFVEAGRS